MFLAMDLQVYFNAFKSMCKNFRICDTVKEQSYISNKEALISFEDEELQKIKYRKRKGR